MARLKALVFDAYGTLFDVHSVGSLCNQLFPQQGGALSQLWRAKQLEYTWLYSLMGRYQDFWAVTERALVYACKVLGLDCQAPTRARLMEAYLYLDPFPDVRPALEALPHYELAILSNGSPRMLKAVVESAGMAGLFAQVISADEARVYKPSPKVYQLAIQRLGLDSPSVGFISANCFDVAGAGAFGFWTCWVNRTKTIMDELGVSPDAVVDSLTKLADVLKP